MRIFKIFSRNSRKERYLGTYAIIMSKSLGFCIITVLRRVHLGLKFPLPSASVSANSPMKKCRTTEDKRCCLCFKGESIGKECPPMLKLISPDASSVCEEKRHDRNEKGCSRIYNAVHPAKSIIWTM